MPAGPASLGNETMTLKTLNRTVAVLAVLGLSACSNGMFGSSDNDDDRDMQNSSVLSTPDATSSGGINGEVNSTGVGGANAGSASGNVGGFSGTGAGSAAD